MKDRNRTYIAIDLKSFYASVECVERGLDPLTANLVVADNSRTEKTICLAVSPSLKSYGISGRARLFEVVQRVREIKAERGEDIEYIVAPPRMALYMEYSTKIYKIYLKYAAPEDMHVYSIDEIFIDVTQYLNTYKMNARELARKIIMDVFDTTGIQRRQESGIIFICVRLLWILWQSTLSRISMAYGLRSLMKRCTGSCCGIISLSRIFGE